MRKISLIIPLLFLFIFTANSQNYKFGKVSKEEVLQKEHPIKKNANAAILYRNQKVFYDLDQHDGFTLVTEIHERIKIYNKEGFDWATKKIRKYIGKSDHEEVSQLKGYTYNIIDGKLEEEKLRNDEIFEEESSKYWEYTKFTMPAVAEGSVIEYTYQVRSPFLQAIGKTPLQFSIPLDKLELKLEIPEYLYFSRYQNLKSPLPFKIKEEKKRARFSFSGLKRGTSMNGRVVNHSNTNSVIEYLMNVYKVDMEDVPALKVESHVDNLNTYAAFLDWELQYTKFPNSTVKNYSETWEGVTKSIYSDIGIENELNRDNFYNDELDEIIAGLSDPMMKAEKIFNYVKQTVKWNDYLGFFPDNGTKKAFKEGSGNTGDINLLLISMLKYANLKAYPILLSTPSNGVPLFPTRDGFNYIIAGLEIDGNIVLLDATDPMTGIGELPKRARNWQGRLIKEKGESAWVNLMPNYLSENSIKMNYKFDGSKIVGWNRNDYSRLFAKDFRTEHGDSEVKNNIEKRIQGISGIEISDYKAENKNKLGSEITESFEFELSSAAESIGDKIYFQPLLFEALSENPFKSEERIYPVFFDFPEIKSYTINIMIPDGYKIVSLPESLALRLGEDDGEFKFIINGNGNVIRLISNVTLKKTAYLAEEYKFLKKFYANIIKKHSEAIVLEKIKQDGNIERTESGR